MADHPLTGRTRQIAEAISSAIRTSRSQFAMDATVGDMAEAVDKMLSRSDDCGGHGLADRVASESEAGSVAALARSNAGAAADGSEAVRG